MSDTRTPAEWAEWAEREGLPATAAAWRALDDITATRDAALRNPVAAAALGDGRDELAAALAECRTAAERDELRRAVARALVARGGRRG